MNEVWTIERVEIRTPEERKMDWWSEPDGIPPDVVRCAAFGRMADGRPFYNESWVTMELFNDLGEERLREYIKEMTHPPEDDSPNRVELDFTD